MSVSRGIALESNFLCKAENNLSKHLKTNHQLNLMRTKTKLKFYSLFEKVKQITLNSSILSGIPNVDV